MSYPIDDWLASARDAEEFLTEISLRSNSTLLRHDARVAAAHFSMSADRLELLRNDLEADRAELYDAAPVTRGGQYDPDSIDLTAYVERVARRGQ